MLIGYFTERPYRWIPEDEVLRNHAYFAISNKFFDREKAADDYNYFLDEYCYGEELGFDALALNEHHGNPFCMGSVMNVEASILARITKKPKIVLIGNPLPVLKHPLRMAEELAEIDLISHGRLVAGWVRGAGSEQFFNNANPAYNRELFNEAHDFIIQAWTRPGPWRYEGKHFNYRHVNPWALPYQKPHPQMWIPGVLSPETVQWCAEHRYPYIGLGTAIGPTCDLWDYYADAAANLGYQAGPENFGYLVPTFLAETEERAQELGRNFAFGGGQNAFSRPEHTLPPGYNSKDAIRRLSHQPGGSWLGISADKLGGSRHDEEEVSDLNEVRAKLTAGYKKSQQNLQTIIGTPKTVLPKLKTLMRVLRPGVLIVFNIQGPVSNEDRMTSMRLLANEVMPAMREYADQLELPDSYTRTPGSVAFRSGTKRDPVVDRSPLAELGLK
ncbi:MAG: LLM class flavin-dependent oxidoreductase [Candidatus Binatus sp.]|uniref:LLM class flavin-dependent oxidoreductase n=1 Tax=Candidatus Binatus sp. TaxID=2811406 RepID=UPI002716A913|nr:LLM class flavin-dependent oxidoreductase [Candidatus Binatus sp.]MDO8435018.1 LLM class flavin-dependent oxidoreductase [Candidatus Binatus sp.]